MFPTRLSNNALQYILLTVLCISFIHQDVTYWKTSQCFVLKLKVMHCNHQINTDHPKWRPAIFIIELCLCLSLSNVSLQSCFSQMNLLKTKLIIGPIKQWHFERFLLHQNHQIIPKNFYKDGTAHGISHGTVPSHVNSGEHKASKNGNQRYWSDRMLIF